MAATINAIVFGATGMVGEGVLHECLKHPAVGTVLVIGRRPCGVTHPKLKEIIHQDFFDFSTIAGQLSGYTACFFCLGVSSLGKSGSEYRRITYDLTIGAARILSGLNPDMTFCYVSGIGTDSTEKGRLAWARIKGKTENDLRTLPFKGAYMFRPGYIQPTPGLKNANTAYTFLGPLYPLWKAIVPSMVCTLEELGVAMIRSATDGYQAPILESRDIVRLARSRRDT